MALQTNQTKKNKVSTIAGDFWLKYNPHRKAANMTGKLASDRNFTRKYRSSNVHLFEGVKTNG